MTRRIVAAVIVLGALAACGGDEDYSLDVRVDGDEVASLSLADLAELAEVEPKRGEPGPSLADVLRLAGVDRGDGVVDVSGDRGRYTTGLEDALGDDESFFSFTKKGTVKLETQEGEDVRHARRIEVRRGE